MNLPDHKVVMINHTAKELKDVEVKAVIWPLDGKNVRERSARLGLAANACTNCFTINGLPKDQPCFVYLTATNRNGESFIRTNLYWLAVQKEEQLQALNALPKVKLDGKAIFSREQPNVVRVKLTNSSKTPALMVRLTLRSAKTGRRILPVGYYGENYHSLLPDGYSYTLIARDVNDGQPLQVDIDGWNVVPMTLKESR
jgi:hypothetical protein